MGARAARQILNIGLDAPRNPEVLRWYLRYEVRPDKQVGRVRHALYTLGYISADLERHGGTCVVKLQRPINDTWLYWLCKQVHQDCIAVVTNYSDTFPMTWHGKLVGPARLDYEPFQPDKFIGLPEDY